MRKIKNIEKIIESLTNPLTSKKYIFNELKGEFDLFSKDKSEKIFSSKKNNNKSEESKKLYDIYSRYDSSDFKNLKKEFLNKLENDGINYCCYCGKTEIFTTKTGGKRTYDIEHFLPRSKYPELSVNLLNWLPVCKPCNSVVFKGTKDPIKNGKEIFHPYLGFLNTVEPKSFDEKYSFCKNDNLLRKYIYNSNHSNFFELEDLYLSSSSTGQIENELLKLQDFLKGQKDFFKKSNIPFDYINYLENDYPTQYPLKEKQILKYSNGKLKKDLIENLNI